MKTTVLRNKPHFRQMFETDMGKRDEYVNVEHSVIAAYHGKLPYELLMYWEKDGWCSYRNGLFWLVNPADYHDVMLQYLEFAPQQWKIKERTLYVIARSAFGELQIWEPGKGETLGINLFGNTISFYADAGRLQLDSEDAEYEMSAFMGVQDPRHLDKVDGANKPLFERALAKFGRVKSNEMYGLKLNEALGGRVGIRNLDKMDLFVYADIQMQIEKPTYGTIDIDSKKINIF